MTGFNCLKYTVLILFGICWAMWADAEALRPSSENIALVNGAPITRKSYEQEVLSVKAQFAHSGKPLDGSQLKHIEKEILDELVESELLYQASQEKGVCVDEAHVEREFLSIRQQFASEKAFQKGLEEMNMSVSEMKEKLKKSLIIEAFITQHITQGVTVAEDDVERYYQNRPELFESPLYIRVSHILITVSPEASSSDKDAAKNKLRQIEEQLKDGADFAELARQYSDGPSKVNGGDIGFFERGEMEKSFEDAAFALPKGCVSGIVETRFGYHLIKTTDCMQDPPVPYKIAQYDIRKKLELEKSRQLLDSFLKDLRGTAKIEVMD